MFQKINLDYIYKIADLRLGIFEPHKQNPVLIDSRRARNAGLPFVQDGYMFRPSQQNIKGIYGKGLNINRIEKLTLFEYSERMEYSVEPNFNTNLQSLHHLCQSDTFFIFDCAKTYEL